MTTVHISQAAIDVLADRHRMISGGPEVEHPDPSRSRGEVVIGMMGGDIRTLFAANFAPTQSRRVNLIRSAAVILAEIERMDAEDRHREATTVEQFRNLIIHLLEPVDDETAREVCEHYGITWPPER